MITPLSMDDASIYEHVGGSPDSPLCIGVFIQNSKPLPVQFYGEDPALLVIEMQAWLLAEREKLAKRESHLAYLRSEEAIAARKAASAARKAAKAAAE
jgi:hypothetical protein